MQVLIVDDNEQNLYLLRVLLESNSHRVETAANGVEALEKARRDPPAVIVSDVLMPLMDGFTLCREWQKDERLRGIPFVFYTGTYTDLKDEEFALSLGAERFIVKPQEPDVFVGILHQVLKEAEEGRPRAPGKPVEDEELYLKIYSERLVNKLEDKMLQLERAHRRLNTLYQASVALSAIQPPGELLPHILRTVVEAMGFDNGSYFDYDRERQEFRLMDAVGIPDELVAVFQQELVFRLGEERGLVGLVGQTREPLIVADTQDEPRWVTINDKIRSALFVPVVLKGELIGVAEFLSTEPEHFGSEDARNVMILANNVSVAVENANLVERLSQSEDRFRRLADNAPDLIYRYRLVPAPGFEYISPAATSITGYTPEEHYADPELGFKLVHPDDLPLLQSYFQGEGAFLEPLILRWVRKNGTVLWAEQRNVPIYDEGGNLIALEGIARDITERKRAEEELKRHVAQLALINDLGSQIASVLDLDALLDRAAHLIQASFGYHHVGIFTADCGQGEFSMQARAGEFATLYPHDFRVKTEQGLIGWVGRHGQTVLANDVSRESRYVNLDPDRIPTRSELSVPLRVEQEIVGVLDLQSPELNAFDEDDVQVMETLAAQLAAAFHNARLYQAVQQELGERLRAEEELRRLKEFNEGIVQKMAEGILLEDAGGYLTFANPAAAAMLGYTAEELVGQHWASIVPPDQQPIVRAADERRAHGQTDRYKVELVRKDGARLPVLVSASPLFNGDTGAFAGAVAVFADLSELKRLEEQFQQAQKMEAIGRLAGGVAHDFNNLLTVIHLSTRLLEKGLHPEDPIREHVQRIQEAAQRAVALIKRLLAFSRQEVVQPRTLDLNAAIEDVSKMLRRMIGDDIELQTVLAGDLGPAYLDPVQMEQVIMNLAVNARDAMPQGGRLTIETANVLLDEAYAASHMDVEPGEYIQISVSDTGVGMSDEVQARIFEPFFTTKERNQGTGLGLATVYRIVKQNGGHIWVHSKVGQGTAFTIYLPRARQADAWKAPPPPPADVEARGAETILLVEDDANVRDLAFSILQAQGYKVLPARDGPEALLMAKGHEGSIDLLIADIVMPRMNGRELADRLQRQMPGIRVLFTSGYMDKTIASYGLPAGGVAFLPKPFSLESLMTRVREVLDAPY